MEPRSVNDKSAHKNTTLVSGLNNQEFRLSTVHRLHTFPQVMFPHHHHYLEA